MLPLGRAVQHTGEIDASAPLEQLWVFGKPAVPLGTSCRCASQLADDGTPTLRVADDVQVHFFGDPLSVGSL